MRENVPYAGWLQGIDFQALSHVSTGDLATFGVAISLVVVLVVLANVTLKILVAIVVSAQAGNIVINTSLVAATT